MPNIEKKSRRQQILESLATMLEAAPGGKITTAALAKEVGVSEAALYRHFPSKSKMFEGLIEFIEEAIFSRVGSILEEDPPALDKCQKILFLLLAFSSKNPGITRVLTGDALVGETDRLRIRAAKLFDRIETQLKQLLRDAELREGVHFELSIADTVNLMVASAEGRIAQFVRSEFKRSPIDNWSGQWARLCVGLVTK